MIGLEFFLLVNVYGKTALTNTSQRMTSYNILFPSNPQNVIAN